MPGRGRPSTEAGCHALGTCPRDGARMNGVPVVVGASGDIWPASKPRNEANADGPGLPPLDPGLFLSNRSADLEYWPLLDDLAKEGISFTWEEPSSLDELPPRFLLSRSTAGLVGVPRPAPSFSPSSSLCLRIFFLRASHDSLIALLSYWEKGRGGTRLLVAAPVGGGGSGERGSSMARGEV